MPNIKSAIKRVRKTETTELKNISQKNDMRSAVKRAKQAIESNADNKQELISQAVKRIDKASQSHLIHSNKADRMKSKLMSAK
ncbi:30S ribosomal protein S20 [Staphylococcus felis]|uniref:Small ribosomal subunit protein bS20 n=1 Tax=Staphylococcus felis TaxID=46127 RepID=A0A2K3ZB78_9STAP|nr:30S ribosomal protein S20 [Staphylococcus felis]AVP37187.1 30S ribosomal protein S20 [Staphylococcus felis]MBH9581198.1 30S ribosomal protein S20 [Staphylococcus felis]MDM8328657.1 30S ribosomal protein S20 [Staphylococcus felis]MDQ7192441.1 30S ribosomal protein S20 [Staphylococcus felis]PNZ35106.1 30S ribosomal protein S20 [Staphylococcus felis]